mgnify:CR=1 FL=1
MFRRDRSVFGCILSCGDDGNYYLLCTDSDVDIGVDGTLRAAPENSYMGMKGRYFA